MDFQTDKFTIFLSWDGQEADNYTVNIILYSVLTTTVPSLHFEAEYNIPILITLRAVNCAGESERVTVNVSVGKCSYMLQSLFIHYYVALSWLFSSRFPCKWQCQ